MKINTLGRIITLSLVVATTIHATNGDNLISVGAKSRGMGGTGIAVSHGAESTLNNPALITDIEGTEVAFGGTLFMPTIKSQLPFPGNPEYTSNADMNMIPEVSIAHKLSDNWFIGIGMWGTAGMGTDYSKAPLNPSVGQMGNFHMVTNLQLLQFGISAAYKIDGLSIALTPILQYGNLDINYFNPLVPPGQNVGAGLAQDFGFGYNVGATYDFSNNGATGLTLGAFYKSSIEMNYDGQLSTAMAAFGVPGFSDALEQPAEYGLGVAYTTGQHTLAFDYRNIQWSDAKGYSDFQWEDQDVYAFGYEYSQNNLALRIGYNYGSSAVTETANPLFNVLNLLGFPATSETHYTLGGTYTFTEQFSLDLAYVYSPKTTETFDASRMFGLGAKISTSHQESSASFQLVYKF